MTTAVSAEPDPLAALWWVESGAPGAEALERESWRRVAPFEARERWRALAGNARVRGGAPLIAAGIADDDEPAAAGILLAVEWRGGRRVPLPFVLSSGGLARRDPEALGALAERALRAQPMSAEPAQFTSLLATVMPDARAQLVALSAARRGGIVAGPGRQAAIAALAHEAMNAHRTRADTTALETARALLAQDLPFGLDALTGRLVRGEGSPCDLATRIAELAGTMLPPPAPPLDGTPRLVLVAAILVASHCPSDCASPRAARRGVGVQAVELRARARVDG